MPPVSWFEAIFFGLCQLAIAASFIFWSHWWRRRKLSELGGILDFYRGRPIAEAFASHLGHFFYFVLAWLFASLGFALIAGGVAIYIWGSAEGTLENLPWLLPACIGLGLAFTVTGMSTKTGGPPSSTS